MKNQREGTEPAGPSNSASPQAPHRRRFAIALALSIYYHVLILSLQFGATGLGLPGLALPWAERRVQAVDLNVRIVEAPRPPAPAPEPLPVPPRESSATVKAERTQPATPSRADATFEGRLPSAADAAPLSLPRRETRAPAPAAKARARDRKIRAKPRPPILAQSAPQEETFKVPAPKRVEPEPQRAPESAAKKQTEEPPRAVQPTEDAALRQAEETARLEAEEAARQRAEEEARQRALALQKELEATKQEEARRLEDAKKQEDARRLALELEARRLAEESARQEEALVRQRALALQKEQDAKKLEEARAVEETRRQQEVKIQEDIKKQEEARRLTLEMEALKRAAEAARQQAAARKKEEDARRQAEEAAARAKELAEGQRLEAQAGAQREKERLAAQQPAAPGALSGKELAAKAIDQLRSARTDPAVPQLPPAKAENPRRRSLFGVERDVSLRMYVESWRWKTERNGALNYRPSASMRASENPIVTVSIRSDGSLEDVVIHRSSGVRELDNAVRRIARLLAPYSAFPPDLARQYDVIEIRRVWSFENALKIMDEM